MAAIRGLYVWDIPVTFCGKVMTNFIYGATTKCSWASWRTKTVNIMYIENNRHIALWLTMMHGQQLLTLHWRSLSRWGREQVVFSLSYKGSQYFVYDCLQPLSPQITHNTQPTIVDAHLEDGAERVSQSVLPKMVATKSSMTICNLSAVWSPWTQDQKWLTLCWHSC